MQQLLLSLLDCLHKTNAFNSRENRDVLLMGLPDVHIIARSEIAETDLRNILTFASRMVLTSGQLGIDVLITNALRLVAKNTDDYADIVRLFNQIKSYHGSSLPDKEQELSKHPSGLEIPFTNRTDEIKAILSSMSPPHHVLDGPAGYGKTKLLLALKASLEKREQKNFLCAYASLKEGDGTLDTVVRSLCKELDLDADYTIGKDGDAVKWGYRFGNQVIDIKFPESRNSIHSTSELGSFEGLVLLFDDGGPQAEDVTRDLLQDFVPAIEETLRDFPYFSQNSHRFRVIVCGRYLAKLLNSTKLKVPWLSNITMLRPFDYEVVLATANKVFDYLKQENLRQVAAHILRLTGGHPLCMAQILDFYRRNTIPPEKFLDLYSDHLWKEFVSPQIKEIREEIPEHLRPIFERLSIFRFFDSKILKGLSEEKKLEYDKDISSLIEELLQTWLYSKVSRYYRDEIVRRMMVLRLRQNDKNSEFSELCDAAFKTCLTIQANKNLQGREYWAIECLFQALQKHANSIDTPGQRADLRKQFFTEVLPQVLGVFILDIEGQEDELDAIVYQMNLDWDFRFTVNYYLRGDRYDEEPFEQLVTDIRAWRKEEDRDV